jgi:hypothetical protein
MRQQPLASLAQKLAGNKIIGLHSTETQKQMMPTPLRLGAELFEALLSSYRM